MVPSKFDKKTENEGKLKIFLGMAPGVGKTYAMIKAAHELILQGKDVVIAQIETRGFVDVENLLKDFEVLPQKHPEAMNLYNVEIDLDHILQRKPDLVLIDDLAHTNARGSRHAKRYQDIQELLKAGIHVFSSANIHHVQSRVDLVREIVDLPVEDTVPDAVFDQADEVILIDMSPEELLIKQEKIREMEKGSSYTHFDKEKLVALRELSLRFCAERVDKELHTLEKEKKPQEKSKDQDLLIASISASPYGEPLVRWTRRLADKLDAKWMGVFVDDGRSLVEEEKALLMKNLDLVSRLGGEVVSTQDTDPVQGLIRVAKQHKASQIIVGCSQQSKMKRALKGGSFVDKLQEQAPDLDVHVVGKSQEALEDHHKIKKPFQFEFPWYDAGILIMMIIMSWFLGALLGQFVGHVSVGLLFLIAVNVSALFISATSTLTLAIFLAVLHVFFFIPPAYSFYLSHVEDFMIPFMFFIAAGITSNFTNRLARKEEILDHRQKHSLAFFELVKDLSFARSVNEVCHEGLEQYQKVFEEEIAMLLPTNQEAGVELRLHPESSFFLDEKEREVADWVYANGRSAGQFTDSFSEAVGSYYPLRAREGTMGVIGIRFMKDKDIHPDLMGLIETFNTQIAASLEREYHYENTKVEGLKPQI